MIFRALPERARALTQGRPLGVNLLTLWRDPSSGEPPYAGALRNGLQTEDIMTPNSMKFLMATTASHL